MGYDLSTNFKAYAGAVAQELDGDVNFYGNSGRINLSSTNALDYSESFKNENAYGWLTGLAYTNDDKTFKANLTYRSEIEHKFSADPTSFDDIIRRANNAQGIPTITQKIKNLRDAATKDNKFTTPQSVNLALNKDINSDTKLLFNARWVDWSNAGLDLSGFKAKSQISGTIHQGVGQTTIEQPFKDDTPAKAGGYDVLAYNKDQWSVDLGIDQKLNDKWKVSGAVGWDSGVGAVSHLTPDSGSWSAGIGVQYSPVANYFVQTGFKYYWLKDVKGQHSKQVSDDSSKHDMVFENNYALSYDFKIGYRF